MSRAYKKRVKHGDNARAEKRRFLAFQKEFTWVLKFFTRQASSVDNIADVVAVVQAKRVIDWRADIFREPTVFNRRGRKVGK